MNHALLIPTKGILQLFCSEAPVDPGTYLRGAGGTGPLLSVSMEIDNMATGKIWLCADDMQPLNPRAAEALLDLIQVHMTFRGPVLFVDLSEENAYATVKALS